MTEGTEAHWRPGRRGDAITGKARCVRVYFDRREADDPPALAPALVLLARARLVL